MVIGAGVIAAVVIALTIVVLIGPAHSYHREDEEDIMIDIIITIMELK